MFKRLLELQIIPNNNKSGIKIKEDFEIDVEITRQIGKTVPAKINVYNLADDTIANIKNNYNVIISAGYVDDGGLFVIYTGVVSNIETTISNLDKITQIELTANQQYLNSIIFNKSYKSKISKRTILQDMANLTGLPYDIPSDELLNNTIKFSFNGKVMQGLEQVAKPLGYTVYNDNGRLVFSHFQKPVKKSNQVPLVNEAHGLIGSPTTKTEEKKGVRIICESLFNSELKLGNFFVLQSKYLNITLKCVKIQYKLNSRLGDFKQSIEAVKV